MATINKNPARGEEQISAYEAYREKLSRGAVKYGKSRKGLIAHIFFNKGEAKAAQFAAALQIKESAFRAWLSDWRFMLECGQHFEMSPADYRAVRADMRERNYELPRG